MDGSFACPECGSEVEIEGLAPGRQVRCGFCHRLLQVPYLPRVPDAPWKRQRFGRLKWVRWASVAVGVIAVLAGIIGSIRFVGRQYRAVRAGSINKLFASSRGHEAAGELGMALVDLDAALDLARRSGVSDRFPIEEEQKRRGGLARREAESALDGIIHHRADAFPLGDWLNLVERSNKDTDLRPLAARIEEEFRRGVQQRAAADLTAARRERDSGRVAASLRACERIAKLLPHLAADVEPAFRGDTEALVARLVQTHGVALETPRGHFVHGSNETYRARFMPVLFKALEAKGYLPYRDASPWKSAWEKAFYRMRLEVNESHERNYLSSQNRLTRIEARLTLTSDRKTVWETTPSALTTVPLPRLPAYVATRVAVGERSDEFEHLLYDNARGQIDAKFSQALSQMPACCP